MYTQVLDARNNGMPFAHDGGVRAAISNAILACGRFDSATGARVAVGPSADGPGTIAEFRRRSDSAQVAQWVASGRLDAGLVGAAGGFPRDFEHIYTEILEEARPPLSSVRAWQQDRRVPLGAKTHTVRRRLGQGEAKIYRGGSAFPVVGGSFVEEQFNVIYIVSAVETNHFELLSDSFEGRNQFAADTRMAVRAIDELTNKIFFDGDASTKIHGFLNYPEIVKSVSTETFSQAGMTSADAIVADLNAFVNFAHEQSGGTFQPNRLAVPLGIRNFLFQTRFGTATDITIGQFFLDGQDDATGIRSIDGYRELEGKGPGGIDAMIAYQDDLNSTAAVVLQPPTALPMHAISAIQNQTVYVSAIGGMVMRDVGNNAILFAASAASP